MILKLENVNFTITKNIFLEDIDVDNIFKSNKVLLVKLVLNILLVTKMMTKNVMPVCIMLPKMSKYAKSFDGTKHAFFIKEDEF